MVGGTLDFPLDEIELLAMLKWAGTKRLNAALPAPLQGKVGPETNDEYYYRGDKRYASIWAVDPERKHQKILVWRLHENERLVSERMPQGMQPGCGWAATAIRQAFELLHELWAADVADAKVAQQAAVASREARCRATHAHYAAMLSRHVDAQQ